MASSPLDPDYDPELSYWRDADGVRTDLKDGPAAPTEEWLRSHWWVWSRPRLEELLAATDAPVFVCGIALNQHELLDLFTKVFLLRIDDRPKKTGSSRMTLLTHPGGTRRADSRFREGRPVFETEMLQLGATPLDSTLPTRTVVDHILAHLPGLVSRP